MKYIILMTSVLMSSVSFAQQAEQLCKTQAQKFYEEQGQPSDVRRKIFFAKEVKAGEAVFDANTRQALATYPVATIVYSGTGSYHSGYFQDLIIMEKETCRGVDIFNIYSE